MFVSGVRQPKTGRIVDYRTIGQDVPALAEPANLGGIVAILNYYDGLIEAEEAKARNGAAQTWLEKTRHDRAQWLQILDAARRELLGVATPQPQAQPQVANIVAGLEYTRQRSERVLTSLKRDLLTPHQREALLRQYETLRSEMDAWQAAFDELVPKHKQAPSMRDGGNNYRATTNGRKARRVAQ